MDIIYWRVQENEDDSGDYTDKYLPALIEWAPHKVLVVIEKASTFDKQVRLQEILRDDPQVRNIYCYSLHRLLACPPSKVWGFFVMAYSLGKFLHFLKEPPSGTIKSVLSAITQYQKEHRAELDSLGRKLGRSTVSPDIDRMRALRGTFDKKGHPTSWREIERLTGIKKSTAQRKLKEHLEGK